MPSQSILSDLKEQAKGGQLSTDSAIQIIMTSLINLDVGVSKLADELECSSDANATFQKDLNRRVDELTEQVDYLAEQTKAHKTSLDNLTRASESWCMPNPMIALGCFVKSNPKLFITLASFGLMLILLMSIPQVKHSIIIFLGFPSEFADFIAPIP